MEAFMKFITKIGVTCATVAMMASTISYAGTVTTSQLDDNYIGADGNEISTTDYTPNDVTANYDTHWMQVTRRLNDTNTRGSLFVKIHSNFVSYNNESSFSFGDLFLMDAVASNTNAGYTQAELCENNVTYGCNQNSYNSPNVWQYAFDLGSSREKSYNHKNKQDGDLRVLDADGSDLIITNDNRDYQAIMAKNVDTIGNGGKWWNNTNKNYLIMSFDITGTSLMDAAQIALRWQMTCANDIIEVVTDFAQADTTSVPEPSTIMLMLLAGLGLTVSRKNKAKGFNA